MTNHFYLVMLIVGLAVMLSWFVFYPTVGEDDKLSDVLPIFAERLSEDVKVAIIGSGIGGSSAAYFIRKHLGPKAQIDVYEQSNKVGGRLAVTEFDGHQFEAGGSIIHSSNKYMVRFINELGLKRRSNPNSGKFGIYNGDEFVFIESTYSFITKLKMLWRYGFFSLWHLNQSLEKMLEQFRNVYKVQDDGKAFKSVPELLTSIGESLLNYTQRSAEEVMRQNGIGELLIQELVTAVTRNNYGQDSGVNAFTGYVSMAGAQGGSLFSVEGGNDQVPKKLLETSNVTLFLKQHIASLRKETRDGRVVYFLDGVDENVHKEMHEGRTELILDDNDDNPYDVVIVAAPLEDPECYIKCPLCKDWPAKSILGKYQQTVATFIQAGINFTYFGYHGKEASLSDIFTTENEIIPFSSIGRQVDVAGIQVEPSVYKIFSRSKLKDHKMKEVFRLRSSPAHRSRTITWLAYPHYAPPERFSPFLLDDGVFYVNAIERAASAMEMSSIGGRNAALLSIDYLLDTNRIIRETVS